MKMNEEVNSNKLPARVEEIMRAQPLNPFVRMEFEASAKSWSTIEQDSSREPKATLVNAA